MIFKAAPIILRIALRIKSFVFFLAARVYPDVRTKWKIGFFQVVSTLIKFMTPKVLFASKARQEDLSSPYLPID